MFNSYGSLLSNPSPHRYVNSAWQLFATNILYSLLFLAEYFSFQIIQPSQCFPEFQDGFSFRFWHVALDTFLYYLKFLYNFIILKNKLSSSLFVAQCLVPNHLVSPVLPKLFSWFHVFLNYYSHFGCFGWFMFQPFPSAC